MEVMEGFIEGYEDGKPNSLWHMWEIHHAIGCDELELKPAKGTALAKTGWGARGSLDDLKSLAQHISWNGLVPPKKKEVIYEV